LTSFCRFRAPARGRYRHKHRMGQPHCFNPRPREGAIRPRAHRPG